MIRRILVIDDDPVIGEMIRDFLEFDKVDVLLSLTPEDGLFNARYKSPRIILLDLFLPNMNGFEVYQRLKQDNRTKDIPVIIITGHTDSNTLEMMNELGITGVFYKPFHFRHLRSKLLSIIDGEKPDKVICKICGAELDDSWEFCPFDGWKKQ